MDYLTPESLNPDQINFLKRSIALNPLNLIEVKNEFERFFGCLIKGEAVQRISTECRDDIAQIRKDIYEKELESIPIANSYAILALAQSRIEHLLKTPKTIRQNRRIDEKSGREYFEDEKEIDDTNLQKWSALAQNERFNTLKLEIAKIVNSVDKKALPKTGFKPISINTGFQEVEEESANT